MQLDGNPNLNEELRKQTEEEIKRAQLRHFSELNPGEKFVRRDDPFYSPYMKTHEGNAYGVYPSSGYFNHIDLVTGDLKYLRGAEIVARCSARTILMSIE